MQWFCQYLLAPQSDRQQILSNQFTRSFYDFFAENNFARLKEYLQRKYKLDIFADQDTQTGLDRKAFLEDFILFNNPRREEWEKTSKLIEFLNLQKGTAIADIGSGPGYYSFQFSQLVGDKGQVYAIDTVKNHLNYVKSTSQKFGINNIKTVHTAGDSVDLPANSVDIAFLCSLYHNIYAMSREDERDSFVKSIKEALNPDGTLFIIDNALVKKSELPYHGPYIAKELIIGQLKYYGFHLVKEHTYIPQRYILAFKKD
ncbi:MAG: class I SAM-dependent methyltransferase [Hydrococcus sp. RM1_1_31]|nr:class I SAM-dependent methyltransferase [Hydrococcus sp. RM1_1_31]